MQKLAMYKLMISSLAVDEHLCMTVRSLQEVMCNKLIHYPDVKLATQLWEPEYFKSGLIEIMQHHCD